MNNKKLIARLNLLARLHIGEANKGNPFISKKDAFSDFNHAKKLAA